MIKHTVQPTSKGQLPKGKRKIASVRLSEDEHAELTQAAINEGLSMGFITYRRYLAGLQLEQLNNK